jgi:hypothetical protein
LEGCDAGCEFFVFGGEAEELVLGGGCVIEKVGEEVVVEDGGDLGEALEGD